MCLTPAFHTFCQGPVRRERALVTCSLVNRVKPQILRGAGEFRLTELRFSEKDEGPEWAGLREIGFPETQQRMLPLKQQEGKRDGAPAVLPTKESSALRGGSWAHSVAVVLTCPGARRRLLHSDKAARPRAPAEKKLDCGY